METSAGDTRFQSTRPEDLPRSSLILSAKTRTGSGGTRSRILFAAVAPILLYTPLTDIFDNIVPVGAMLTRPAESLPTATVHTRAKTRVSR
jgi:hypothetical protein